MSIDLMKLLLPVPTVITVFLCFEDNIFCWVTFFSLFYRCYHKRPIIKLRKGRTSLKEENEMKIKDFRVERWMDAYETKCEINIAESCVDSLTVEDLICISSKTRIFQMKQSTNLRKKSL